LEVWIDQLHQRYSEYGLPVSRMQAAQGFGNLKAALAYGLPKHQLSEFQEGVNDAVRLRLPEVPLYDDAHQMLVTLKKRGKKLALVTTSLKPNLDLVMGRHGIAQLFDVIVTSEDVHNYKPDPESINVALQRLQAPKSRAIMLGDTAHDLRAARNAGVASALFYPDAHTMLYDLDFLQSHNPTYVIRAWQELLDQLQ